MKIVVQTATIPAIVRLLSGSVSHSRRNTSGSRQSTRDVIRCSRVDSSWKRRCAYAGTNELGSAGLRDHQSWSALARRRLAVSCSVAYAARTVPGRDGFSNENFHIKHGQ